MPVTAAQVAGAPLTLVTGTWQRHVSMCPPAMRTAHSTDAVALADGEPQMASPSCTSGVPLNR